MGHDVVNVSLGTPIDDASGQRHQRFDPAGGLLRQNGPGLVLAGWRIAVPTAAVRIVRVASSQRLCCRIRRE